MEKVAEASSSIRALVVDDDVVNRMIHEKMLKSVGVTKLEVVSNGQQALDIHSSGHSFDLILMDLDMPIMDGIQATKTLRSRGIQSRIAGVSARCVDSKIEEFMKAGLDSFHLKPLTLPMLSSILQTLHPKPLI